MDNQENAQPNIQESDNQLLIDFIKDTYTIESINKVFFFFKDNETQPFFSKDNNKKLKLPVYRQGLNGNGILLQSDSKHKEEDYIADSSDTSIASKYNFIEEYKPSLLVIDKSILDKDIDEYIKNILEECKKNFSSTVLSQNTQGKYTNVLTLFQNIFNSNDNIRQQIALLSIYYYNKSVFTSFHDARKFLNTYINDYNKSDIFKQRLFEKTYNDNHFFMWFYIRYYINRTITGISLKNSNDKSNNNISHYYPRIKEAAILGICNKSNLQENKDKAMFNACLDIFQVLNFSFSDLCVGTNLNLGKYKNEEVTCYSIMCDTYGQQVDTLAKTITFSENIKSNLLTISDIGGTKQEEENDILDCNSIDIILKLFKDYIVSKIKPKLDEDWQGYIDKLNITNIFATINPNFYLFKRGVNKYKTEYYEERVVLIFVKLNNIMQIRFDEILETKCKIIIILYDEINDKESINNSNNSSNDKLYLIECAGMTSQNIRIFFYDTELAELISLYGESELALDENNKIPTGVFSNNQDIKVEYNSFQNVLLLFYGNIVFKFINYKAVLNELGIAGITLKNNIQTSEEAKNQPSPNEIKIITTVTAIDNEIIQEYVKDLPFYMFIKSTEEIITGKFDKVEINNNKLQVTYEFTCRLLKEITNNNVRFSFVKKSFFYTNSGYGTDKHVGVASINNKDNKYNVSINFNFSNLPDRVYIRDVIPLSYSGYSLKAEVKLEIVNQTKSVEDIDKCIIWKYVLLDKDMKEVHIPVQNALSLTDMYDNGIDKVTGRILDICFMERLIMYLYGEHNTPQQAIAFIPSIEGLGPYQDFICSKYAIILGYNGSSKGVTSSSSQIFYASNDSYIDLQAFHEPYLDNKNIKYTHWICKVNDFKEKPQNYTEMHPTNIIENKNILKPDEMLNLLYKDEEMYKLPVYGRNIRVYYREEWFGKKIFFYPLNRLLEHRIVEVWHIEQPISLKFNGEKLQIIEDGNIIEEYEARSGQMENRDVAVTNTNVLTQHDNQTVSDNQTQDNNTLPLNIVNDNDNDNDNDNENLKAVHYPGYSAGNTLNIVKNEKFYYDDKATNKIPEGSYYIMANDIKTNPNISKDALNVQGSRYMHMFEHHNIDFTDEKSFNNIITTKDYIMNVTSHYNYFMTSNIIHGGIEYGDKGGIDLSEKADNFFNALNNIIDNTHKEKLYKVYGKVPIKLEVKYGKSLSIEEARVRAFLRMLRVGEGTKGPNGYETIVGGKLLKDYGKDFSQHPNILIKLSSTLQSTAAGAYQFLWSTWKDYAIKNGIHDFSPINQDKVCVILLKDKRHALDDIMKGNVRHAIELCNKEWASLPGSPYGQRTETMETCLAHYMMYLEEEINGKTSLAVPIGELDDLLFK